MSNNGDKIPNSDLGNTTPQKTQAQLAQERKERYDKDPESFVEDKDIVAVYYRSGKGHRYGIGNASQTEFHAAKSKIQFEIDEILRFLKIPKKKSGIITSVKGAFGGRR